VTLYLDTSSAIKLYVSEAGSDKVRKLVEDATVVATSVVTYAETPRRSGENPTRMRANGWQVSARRSASSKNSGRPS
jgi:predicted nucleic acid-binding protein